MVNQWIGNQQESAVHILLFLISLLLHRYLLPRNNWTCSISFLASTLLLPPILSLEWAALQFQVADELVAEFSDPDHSNATPDQRQYDEKNIRRRVYDALNVLMAMDIISKDKKEIQWKGLPRTSLNDVSELKNELLGFRNRIEKKAAYLAELEEQYVGLQSLIQRNVQLYGLGNAASGGVALPFIMVQTRPRATVEVEISEDMQLVHFDFNSTPFELHDDYYVLKAMKFCEKPVSDTLAQDLPADGGKETSIPNMYPSQITHS